MGKLVPEAVTAAHKAHLRGDDASEGGTHHGPGQGPLRNSAAPQVDVVGVANNQAEQTFSFCIVSNVSSHYHFVIYSTRFANKLS